MLVQKPTSSPHHTTTRLFSYNYTARFISYFTHNWTHSQTITSEIFCLTWTILWVQGFSDIAPLYFTSIFFKPRCIPVITRPLAQFRRTAEKVESGPAMPLEWVIRPHSSACTSCIELHIAFGCLKTEAGESSSGADFHTDLQADLHNSLNLLLSHAFSFPTLNSQKILIYHRFIALLELHVPGVSIKLRATHHSRTCLITYMCIIKNTMHLKGATC